MSEFGCKFMEMVNELSVEELKELARSVGCQIETESPQVMMVSASYSVDAFESFLFEHEEMTWPSYGKNCNKDAA